MKELNLRMGTTATLFDEFRADRGYFGTEFGNRPAGLAHLTAARGNGFHGSAYETHLNSLFNARSFFTVGDLPPAVENLYGFNLVFRPWKNAAFSGDAGQNRIRGNVNGNVLVPKADERVPLATDPARRALIQRFLEAYPKQLPNRTDINERALNTNAQQSIDDDQAGARLDQTLSSKDSVALRYQFTRQRVDAFQLLAGQNPDTTTRAHLAQITWTRAWSASTVVNFTASFDRITSLLVPEPNAVGPAVSFSNVIANLGPSSFIPLDRAQSRFQYATALRQASGNHNWYAGAGLSRRRVNGFESSSHRGTLQFRNDFGRDAMTNFLLGIPNRFSGATGHVHRGFRQWEPQFYAGDSFRATPNLSLNYGLRYEIATRPVEVNGLNQIPYGCDCNNLAPRFGLAYRLPGKWGVVRSAYGLHYGEIFTVTYQQIRYNSPLNRKFEIQVPDLLTALSQLSMPVNPNERSAILDISPDLATPYSHQYNFTWEPAIADRWRLQLGYAGSRSHKLLMMWYTNRARNVPGIPLATATVTDRRADILHHDVRRILNGSRGYFDAARATLILPRWHGLTVDASYWWSHAIDLGAGYTNTATGEDGRQSQSQAETDVWSDLKSHSVFDQRHAFLWRVSYATPRLPGRVLTRRILGSWDLSAITLVKTGTPFSVITGSDAPGFGNVDGDQGDRPHLLDPSVLGRTIGHPDTSLRLLPRSAFAFLRVGEARGNLGSNTFRKAEIANVNASASRTFTVSGDRKLVARAEAVNFFNTPQFAEPSRELSSPSFGFLTNTLNDGRAFRFSLRFLW